MSQNTKQIIKFIFRDIIQFISRFRSLDKNTVLIVRLDAMGDYVLFRNFLEDLRMSEKYKDKKIILCGLEQWRDLAIAYDGHLIDEFIWFNWSQFFSSYAYKFRIIKSLRRFRAYEIIYPIYGRYSEMDFLLGLLGGAEVIAPNLGEDCVSGVTEAQLRRRHKSYTKIIQTLPDTHFEYYRNASFMSQLTGVENTDRKLHINVIKSTFNKNKIGIIAGAGDAVRCWSAKNFVAVLQSIYAKYPQSEFVLLGHLSDSAAAAQYILANIPQHFPLENKVGATHTAEFCVAIADCKLLISNETSGVHIAAAVGTPAVCISNGNHFGRFNPYKEPLATNITTIYPDESFYATEKYLENCAKYRYGSALDINLIESEKVASAAYKYLEIIFSNHVTK